MSHQHERAEKICLNCGVAVHGLYCQNCGQENTDPRESAGHMVRHFLEDITHFDGKLFKTLKYLLMRPGFLAQEYMNGRRVSYLHPIRMYLFVSAICFIILSSLFGNNTVESKAVLYARDTIEQHNKETAQGLYNISLPGTDEHVFGFYFSYKYAHNGALVYDSLQRVNPGSLKDGYIASLLYRKLAAVASTYHESPNIFMEKFNEKWMHSLSKVFFFSLPFFALLLQLLYLRQKKYFFVAHAIFSLHFYCFVFIWLLTWFGIFYLLIDYMNEPLFYVWVLFTLGGMFGYLLFAMHRFYKQVWYKTITKFAVQSVFFTSLILIFTIVVFLNSMIALAGH